jgi:predicted nucleic acid-binding protein
VCIILDTNRFGDAFSDVPDPRYVPLLRWLTDPEGDGSLVFGGTKYRGEIAKHQKAREFFVQRWRAGRAHRVDDPEVDSEEERLRRARACASDDEHVIALARASGARVVCTEDHGLWRDVADKALLDAPRGRIYRAARHEHLLHHDPGCRKPPATKVAIRKTRRRRS